MVGIIRFVSPTQPVGPRGQNFTTRSLQTFGQTYVSTPRLSMGLNYLDIGFGGKVGCKAWADNVDASGFYANIEGHSDNQFYYAGMNALVLKPADLDFQSGEFTVHSWDNNNGPNSDRIQFQRPFNTPPKVVVYIKGFSILKGSSTRIKVYPSHIDAQGFTIHIDAWSDTVFDVVTANWVAYPEDREHIISGTARTASGGSSQPITFQGASFYENPNVFLALNEIDVSTAKNMRVKTYIDNVSTKGCTWHIDTWDDTIVYNAGISYLIFN